MSIVIEVKCVNLEKNFATFVCILSSIVNSAVYCHIRKLTINNQ